LKHDGRAALCPTLTEAESPEFVQPDLKQLSLEQAWQEHPTFRRLRGMQCENASVCPSGNTCRGGCRSNAYLLHGDISSPDEMSCNIHKNDAGGYRPFLTEYEQMRADGRLPARGAERGRPVRRLTVLS
jgi:radical SAM protein with 4Fe4S-binding SPASM domain